MIQLFGNTKINFVGLRFIAYIISSVLVFSGLFAIVQMSRGKGNIGIDFAGGSVVSIKFKKELDAGKIREVLDKNGFKDTGIQQIADTPTDPKLKVLLRIKASNVKIGGLKEAMTKVFTEGFPGEVFEIDRIEDMGPIVSAKLKGQAFWAIFFAILSIMVYIWFRFEFRFGLAGAVATLHDVLAVIGIFYFMNKEFTLLFVTALLTLAGYSLTDTVVVFDRIRENLKIRVKDNLDTIINSSVNEVLSRTFMTSLTVLIVVTSLFLYGGEVIHDFSFALMMGVVIGTYSSWFVASPILIEWEHAMERKAVVVKK
ncbi:MAG: protein-export membrane protein SecF [Candidatus Firestonebacteria bacterium RIFOXYC2_FULL_39_67]|nr:MAG: protein-export membrane protein SecF [Candidatus Firestonebacteria bacterium RIFOXYD2_FULL_39_29]OGF53969.1 MAG: protein-export membrane protein SecF [Candidatus Firestonebacteria bacterium RIFOXYC2_FULL_39_67]OGF56557.1 MAG: protein-export membrane protein SecF [Candidatus Firestonebacteria bacterium RifOxyC12_full_39_7]